MKFAVFEQIKKSLESVKRYALGEIGNVANATVEAVEEIAGELNNKADKPHYITVVIPTEGWLSDDFDYPNYYDIVVEGITENDRADILFLPESMKTAADTTPRITNMKPSFFIQANILQSFKKQTKRTQPAGHVLSYFIRKFSTNRNGLYCSSHQQPLP